MTSFDKRWKVCTPPELKSFPENGRSLQDYERESLIVILTKFSTFVIPWQCYTLLGYSLKKNIWKNCFKIKNVYNFNVSCDFKVVHDLIYLILWYWYSKIKKTVWEQFKRSYKIKLDITNDWLSLWHTCFCTFLYQTLFNLKLKYKPLFSIVRIDC